MIPHILVLISAFIAAIAQYFLKIGSDKQIPFPWNFFETNIFLGLCLYVLSTALYLEALKKLPLSIGYMLTTTSYLWAMLISFFWLKEGISLMNWLGFALVMVGLPLICLR